MPRTPRHRPEGHDRCRPATSRPPARQQPGDPASPARHARRTTSVPWRLSRWGAVVVALLPLLLAGLAIGALGEGERDRQTTDSLPSGYDSTDAAELRDRLPDGDTSRRDRALHRRRGEADAGAARCAPGAGAGPRRGPGWRGADPLGGRDRGAHDPADRRHVLDRGRRRRHGAARAARQRRPGRRDGPGHRSGRDRGRPLLGVRRRQHPAAARHRHGGGGAADHHLPQPGALGRARCWWSASPTGSPRSRPPRSWRRSTSRGTSRRPASSRCWSSEPAPTTPCC